MRTALFVYGTLLDAAITASVIGRPLRGVPARLPGWRREGIRGAAYPGIALDDASSVDGSVCFDLAPQVLRALDRYEGALYERVPVRVVLADGSARDAQVYALKPDRRDLLDGRPWAREACAQSSSEES